MVHAFIMVRTGTGASEECLSAIRTLSEVAEAHIVAGDYDLIVEVEVEDVYSVLHAAASKVQSVDGVTDTRTYVSLSE